MKEFSYTKETKIKIFEESEYKGFRYVILDEGTHPTAYVEIPKTYKYYPCETDKDEFDFILVHGGITWMEYGDNFYFDCFENDSFIIGWHYSRSGDYAATYTWTHYKLFPAAKKWTAAEVLEDVKSVINQLKEKEN